MFFRQIEDPVLSQYSYLIGCQRTGEAIVIDPLRDVDQYLRLAESEGLRIVAAAETHIHADFLAGTRELALRHGVRPLVSDCGPAEWKVEWARDVEPEAIRLRDGDTFSIGGVELRAIHTPGHTPEHVSYLVRDRGAGAEAAMALITGDFVFVGDVGRPDLLETAAGTVGAMEPSARALHASLQQFLELPDHLLVWPGHGAGSACGKALGAVPVSSVGYERLTSPALAAVREGEQPFVDFILDAQPEPPLYFGRMKALNRTGPALLGAVRAPRRLGAAEVLDHLASGGVVLDTRGDRREFMGGHLEGALHAPMGRFLSEVAGSYVEPDEPILLVVDRGEAELAVRVLARIGLDDVVGAITPEDLQNGELPLVATEVGTFEEIADGAADPGTMVLDVRGAAEFRRGHLPGAVHIPYTRLAERMGELPEGRIAVHCASGRRAAFATSLLERRGREVVHVDDDLSRSEVALAGVA